MTTQTTPHQLTTPATIRTFALAGDAVFTLKNTKTGNRFTFKISADGDTRPAFVKVLTGSNNEDEENYTYLGCIFDRCHYRHGKKSTISADAKSALVFAWFWERLDQLPACIEVWHEGRCGRCGRLLTVPESIESGIGPTCAQNMGLPK